MMRRIAADILYAPFLMPTSKIRVSSQGPYSTWLVLEDTNPPPERSAWRPAEWQPPKADQRKEVIDVALVAGAECTITWRK